MIQGERWIIFYSSGDTFSSDDGSAWDAPRESILAIASSSPETGFIWLYGRTYYYFEAERGGFGAFGAGPGGGKTGAGNMLLNM